MMKRLMAIALGAILASHPAAAEQSALGFLAAQVPVGTKAMVSLIDVSALREQSDRIATFDDELNQTVFHFSQTLTLSGLDIQQFVFLRGDFETAMGFPLSAVDGLATWGDLPEEQTVIRSKAAFDEEAISAALKARAYSHDADRDVWHRGEDFAIDFKRRDDPFSQIGKSARFALRGDLLFHSAGWGGMETMLTNAPGLDSDPDVSALLTAIEQANVPGVPTQVSLLRNLNNDASAIPVFRLLGIVQWQDGAVQTGGAAFVYVNKASADAASAALQKAFDKVLPAGRRTMRDIMKAEPVVSVIETDKRTVVLLSTTREADLSKGKSPMMLTVNPYKRLIDMLIMRDLDAFLAAD